MLGFKWPLRVSDHFLKKPHSICVIYRRLQWEQSIYNTSTHVSGVILWYWNPNDCVVAVLGKSCYRSQAKTPILCYRAPAWINLGQIYEKNVSTTATNLIQPVKRSLYTIFTLRFRHQNALRLQRKALFTLKRALLVRFIGNGNFCNRTPWIHPVQTIRRFKYLCMHMFYFH